MKGILGSDGGRRWWIVTTRNGGRLVYGAVKMVVGGYLEEETRVCS